jgi:hypothetical protein
MYSKASVSSHGLLHIPERSCPSRNLSLITSCEKNMAAKYFGELYAWKSSTHALEGRAVSSYVLLSDHKERRFVSSSDANFVRNSTQHTLSISLSFRTAQEHTSHMTLAGLCLGTRDAGERALFRHLSLSLSLSLSLAKNSNIRWYHRLSHTFNAVMPVRGRARPLRKRYFHQTSDLT